MQSHNERSANSPIAVTLLRRRLMSRCKVSSKWDLAVKAMATFLRNCGFPMTVQLQLGDSLVGKVCEPDPGCDHDAHQNFQSRSAMKWPASDDCPGVPMIKSFK